MNLDIHFVIGEGLLFGLLFVRTPKKIQPAHGMKWKELAPVMVISGVLLLSFPRLCSASLIQNPSFESNYNDVFPHYGSIDSWVGGSGVNENAGPFHNPGTPIPDRTRVAFVQGSANLSQDIAGLTAGKQYWVQFFYDARNCCGGTIDIVTKFADTELDRIINVRPALLNSKPYYARSVPF